MNTEIVQIQRLETRAGEKQLHDLIQAHVDNTHSAKGQSILDDWSNQLPKFWQLVPPSEAQSPEASSPNGTPEGLGQLRPDKEMTKMSAQVHNYETNVRSTIVVRRVKILTICSAERISPSVST